ncbi:MAG: flagellar M-ring protein FliF [Treponema sp.]|jgi:flagellar M-ring protein FliF|nr:flagellar M-ring protein FliF [Treponema sp.]
MPDFIKKVMGQIKSLWGKWSIIQKAIFIGIGAAVIGGIIALVSVSASPAGVPVIDAPIKDEAARDRIILRINEEGVRTTLSPSGVIQVPDEKTARRMRGILIREDLIPSGTDPWAIFDRERWTLTDWERGVNFQRAITQMVTDHIKALDDVDDANVTIVQPEPSLFAADQNPVTASVIITPKPGSDITQNRKKVEGIQKLLKYAIQGLRDEYIVITDPSGMVLNDFEGMSAMDHLNRVERESKIVQTLEARYRAVILKSLQDTFSPDRVRDLNLKITMDMSPKTINTKEYYPITMQPQTPGLPYSDAVRVPSIPRSTATSKTFWEGTGIIPEGPAGVEGQTPPNYKDMSNIFGKVTQETLTQNDEINERLIQEERSPQIDRVSVAVNIDGVWKLKYDEKNKLVVQPDGLIEREYTPVQPELLKAAQELIQDAIGYNAARGDSVTVRNIPFDRTQQFKDEDASYFRQKQFQVMAVILLVGLALLLIGFVAFRMISRELERRKRLREEEISRQQQELRASALLDAENEGVEVSMSVEEKKRMELQENAINMAKEHPGDVAQLIRTWLLEE